jgi:hypothetical protein
VTAYDACAIADQLEQVFSGEATRARFANESAAGRPAGWALLPCGRVSSWHGVGGP